MSHLSDFLLCELSLQATSGGMSCSGGGDTLTANLIQIPPGWEVIEWNEVQTRCLYKDGMLLHQLLAYDMTEEFADQWVAITAGAQTVEEFRELTQTFKILWMGYELPPGEESTVIEFSDE